MKTVLIIAIGIIIIGVAVFLYETRSIKFKKTDINAEVTPLAKVSEEGAKLLKIEQASSQVSFALNEVLSGVPTHVVGTSSAVAGEISLNLNRAQLTISEIKIDARTLKTDIERRNNAIARFILESINPGNEYITFKTTQITDLPEKIEVGQKFSYSISGDLTIKGITKQVTFQATSLAREDGAFEGSASSTLSYADFNIHIPSLSFLANVDKEVVLSINFVAK